MKLIVDCSFLVISLIWPKIPLVGQSTLEPEFTELRQTSDTRKTYWTFQSGITLFFGGRHLKMKQDAIKRDWLCKGLVCQVIKTIV